jgi:vacuolar-type H+-ATPase subunit C/Vma6
MIEADRLDALCRLDTTPEFARALLVEMQPERAREFQRESVEKLVTECAGLRPHLCQHEIDWFNWLLLRFQLENVKLLLRGQRAKASAEETIPHLILLPDELELDSERLLQTESLEGFIGALPKGHLRDLVRKAFRGQEVQPETFFREAALDRTYFEELLLRTAHLSSRDREQVQPLVWQEVDILHLMLVIRGKFHYGLPFEQLMALHLDGTRISRSRFSEMLSDSNLLTAAERAVGRVIDELPARESNGASPDNSAAKLEALAWNRFYRLSNRAFRCSNIGFGAVAGYVNLRRIETLNLITISEGIRLHAPAESIRDRMIPRSRGEVPHV